MSRYKAADNENSRSAVDNEIIKKKMGKGKKAALIILLSILGLLVAIAATLTTMIIMGQNALLNSNNTGLEISAPSFAEIQDNYVIYKGQKYEYNKNMTSTLFMGVDKRNKSEYSGIAGEGGQADAIFLMALNTENGKPTLISISRDTMVDVNYYDTLGQFTGTKKSQLCLAHSYGDGKEKSCENTAVSVSRMLYGIPVNSYAAIDLDSLSVLNDAIGGVTVNVLEDLTAYDSAMKKGETVTLHGDQAETYVRSRAKTLESNNLRMDRQKQYITNYMQKALSMTKNDIGLPLSLYNAADDYMVTNIDASKVSYFAYMFITNGFSAEDIVTVPGNVTMGEQYAEFNVNQEEFYEMILDIYYTKID